MMDSCSEVSPPSEDNCKQPVILSYHSLNLESHGSSCEGNNKPELHNVISPAKSYHSTSSSNSMQMEDEDNKPDYSFGLSYDDHCYAQVVGCPLKEQSLHSHEKSPPPIYSHSIDDIHADSFLSIPSSENSLDLLAKVAQAMGPVHSSPNKLSFLNTICLGDNECSLLYTPNADKLSSCMDYNWTVAQEEVTSTSTTLLTTSPTSNASLKKTVSLVIPKHKLAAYQRMKSATITLSSPQTSPGVSRSISVPQESNSDLDAEPTRSTSNSQQPATIKVLKPGSLPIKKLPPLRRYRYSGLPNNSNITRLNNAGGNGLVFTYGGGIIPASNAHVGPIRCPCGYTHDDGYMIQCDKCKIWQHVDCVLREPNNLPANYMCDACLPRNVNYSRAVNVQRQKLAQQQSKKLQHQEIAHQQNQIQEQLIARGLHSSANNRTSKRKQDLQSLSGESTDYDEHMTRLPCSSPSLDQKTSPLPSGVSPCSPTIISGCTTVLTPNGGSTVVSNLAGIVTVSSTGAQIPARNLFLSPNAGEDILQASLTSEAEVESAISPNSRFSSMGYMGNNGYVENYENLHTRSIYSSSNHQYDTPASLTHQWTTNSTQPLPPPSQQQQPNPNGLFNSAASFSHGLPMNHADYDEIRENICTEELRQMFKHKYEAGRLYCYNFKESRPSHPPLTRVVALDFSRKRLEAARYITRSTVVMEYRGCLSLFDEYNYEYDYRKHYNPFVLFYNKLVNVSLCVDARHCGNSARFIRRSCHPNCEVFHIYSSGRLQLLIIANDDIAPGRELTLPFDFDFTKCRYQITCACGKKACQVTRWYKSQDKSHYVSRSPNCIESQNKNSVSMLKKVSPEVQPKILASRDQKYQKYISKKPTLPRRNLDYNNEDDENSQSEEEARTNFLKSRKLPKEKTVQRLSSDVYNFSDNEAKIEKKKRLLKTISNKSRQQRLNQQMSRKLNSTTTRPVVKGMKSARGRGRGALSARPAPGERGLSPSRVKRPSGSSATSKRRASQAFSNDDKSQSSDYENEENTPASTNPRQRRRSSKSSDTVLQSTVKKEGESTQPQAKKSREDIWLAEVLKRIERLEKKKRKKSQAEDQQMDYRSSGELNESDSKEDATLSNNDLNVDETVEISVDTNNTNRTEKETPNEHSQLGNSCNGLDDNEMVIRYHRTSITELQEDLDAITRALPVKCNDTDVNIDSRRLNDSSNSICENIDSKQIKEKRTKSKNNTKLVELNFNDFIQELIPEKQKVDIASPNDIIIKVDSTNESSCKIEEKFSPLSHENNDKSFHSAFQREEQQQIASPQRRKSEENTKKSTDVNSKTLKESRDEKWLRLQLKKIEEMEKKVSTSKQAPPVTPPPPPQCKGDSLDDTLEEVLSRLKSPCEAANEDQFISSNNITQEDNKGNPRRRRQSSKEDAPNSNSKKSRKNSSDNINAAVENGKRSRKASQNNSEMDFKSIKKSNSIPHEVVDKQSEQHNNDTVCINNVIMTTPNNSPKKNIEALQPVSPLRKACVDNQDDGIKDVAYSNNIRSENDNLSSTSSDTDSDDEEGTVDDKVQPIALQAKRRSSAPSGPETRSRVTRSGKKPSAPLRTPATAIEYQERTPMGKSTTKKVSDNWEEQECNLIVYKPQVENPMERFSRSLSTNLPIVSQNLNANPPTLGVSSNAVMPTPTKKRWLNQAILEDEENNFSYDNTQLNNSIPTTTTTPLPAQFSLKKRLMAQYSVDDHCSSPPDVHDSSLNESFTLTQNSLPSNEKPSAPQTLPSFASPTAKLPPKKATMKRREEERLLMEMRKIRVSLSEYRRRRGNQDATQSSMDENTIFKHSDDYYESDLINSCGTQIEQTYQMKLANDALNIDLNIDQLQANFDDTLDQEADIADYSSVVDDCGPRTPSEPNDEEDEDAEKQTVQYQEVVSAVLVEHDNADDDVVDESRLPEEEEESLNKAVKLGGPKTPEMDENEEAEIHTTCIEENAAIVSSDDHPPIQDDTMESTVTTTTPQPDMKPQESTNDDNNDEEDEEDFEKVKIDEEDLQKRISKLYPSHSNEEDVLSLNNILRRDEEIRDMQELKTLERQKNKLLYQLRSVERVLPSDQEDKQPSITQQAAEPSPSILLLGGASEHLNTTPLPTRAKPLISPAKSSASSGRMPLSEKAISPSAPMKKISPNLSVLDAAIKNMQNSLKAQLAAAQQNIKSNYSLISSSSNNSASTSHDQRTKPR